ncbi:ABC transporter substrate-binding protein [Clostridium sp. WILCCON 0269]|uniref:ABC transporter substrate-binding protein n=1 Tax=Candidatus Clostridium eludens TaxID=3381663 RepID=A0ABW8SGX9_9CLOT
MRKNLLSRILVGVLSISLVTITACSNKQSSNKQETGGKQNIVIKYGYQLGHTQIIVARDKGWLKDEFEKDGITFQLQKFSSGPPMIEAMTGKRLDFGQVGDQPAIQARANNVDIKVIAAYGTSEKADALIATKKSGINKISDLKGKKVGVTIGSVAQQLLYIYLKSVGLKPGDIQQVNLQPADIKSSLLSNNIDAAVIWEPVVTQTVSTGTVDQIADGTGYKKEVDVIIAQNSFLKQHSDIAVRLLKVLNKTAKWIEANPEETIKIISKDTGVAEDVLKPGFDKTSHSLNITDEGIQSVKDTAKFLRENKIIRKDVNVDDLIDLSYAKKAGIQ